MTGTIVDTIMRTGRLWTPGLDCDFNYDNASALFEDIINSANNLRAPPQNAQKIQRDGQKPSGEFLAPTKCGPVIDDVEPPMTLLKDTRSSNNSLLIPI